MTSQCAALTITDDFLAPPKLDGDSYEDGREECQHRRVQGISHHHFNYK